MQIFIYNTLGITAIFSDFNRKIPKLSDEFLKLNEVSDNKIKTILESVKVGQLGFKPKSRAGRPITICK